MRLSKFADNTKKKSEGIQFNNQNYNDLYQSWNEKSGEVSFNQKKGW